MPRPRIDMTGQRYGRLVVIGRAPPRPGGNGARWMCRCDCGNTVSAWRQNLISGDSQSCGCLRSERMRRLQRAGQLVAAPSEEMPLRRRSTPLRGRLDLDLLFSMLSLIDHEPLQTQAGLAEQLAVSRPTISRTLAQAEATLGVVVSVSHQHGPGMSRWSVTDWGVLDRARTLARGDTLLDAGAEARRRAYRQA